MPSRRLRTLLAPIWFLAVALAATNVKAAIGESVADLIARYGQPEGGGLSLALGMALWKLEQGEVAAFFDNGKATTMIYNGLDEKAKDTLLAKNLPKGQRWVNSNAAKTFLLSHINPDLTTKKIEDLEIPQTHFLQTADGTLWAMYLPNNVLFVSTPRRMEALIDLAFGFAKPADAPHSESDRGSADH